MTSRTGTRSGAPERSGLREAEQRLPRRRPRRLRREGLPRHEHAGDRSRSRHEPRRHVHPLPVQAGRPRATEHRGTRLRPRPTHRRRHTLPVRPNACGQRVYAFAHWHAENTTTARWCSTSCPISTPPVTCRWWRLRREIVDTVRSIVADGSLVGDFAVADGRHHDARRAVAVHRHRPWYPSRELDTPTASAHRLRRWQSGMVWASAGPLVLLFWLVLPRPRTPKRSLKVVTRVLSGGLTDQAPSAVANG